MEREAYKCFVSAIVLEELSAGDYPTKRDLPPISCGHSPVLQGSLEALDVANVYRRRGLMPLDPAADALHVALASCYHMDYLLTWNCQNLANVYKARRLEELNSADGPERAAADHAIPALSLGGTDMTVR